MGWWLMSRQACAHRRQACAQASQWSIGWREHSSAQASQSSAQKAQAALSLGLPRAISEAARRQAWAQSMSSAMQRAMDFGSGSLRQDTAQ